MYIGPLERTAPNHRIGDRSYVQILWSATFEAACVLLMGGILICTRHRFRPILHCVDFSHRSTSVHLFFESICYGEELSPPFIWQMSCVFVGGPVFYEIYTSGCTFLQLMCGFVSL